MILTPNTMNNPPRLNSQQGQTALEDVLQDPHASWSQIREAMKSSRGCTNAAIMGAIASGRGVSVVSDENSVANSCNISFINDKEKLTDSDVVGAVEVSSLSTNVIKVETFPTLPSSSCEQDSNAAAGARAEIDFQIPLKDEAVLTNQGDDITNSRNRRPSRRADRKGSLRQRASLRRSGRKGGHLLSLSARSTASANSHGNSSVNMMDFGVEPNAGMGTLEETASFDDELLFRASRRGSASSASASISTSGFLGWNHDDESIYSSGVHSNYSDLVDSSGFLDWDHRKSCQKLQLQVPPPPPDPKCDKVMKALLSDGGGRRNSLSRSLTASFTGSFASFTSSFADIVQSDDKPKQVEQWNIEDYENPQDNEINSKGNFRGGFFSNRIRRASTEQQITTPSQKGCNKKEEIGMDDIKEALIKVAQSSGVDDPCTSAPGSRRISIEEESGLHATKKEALQKAKGPRRRKTVMGLPSFLGGRESNEDNTINAMRRPVSSPTSDDMAIGHRRRLTGMALFLSTDNKSDDCDSSVHSNLNLPSLRRHRSDGMPCIIPSSEKLSEKEGSASIWDGLNPSSQDDSREAIWINRKDGNVDIEKECRKLYRNSSSGNSLNETGNRRRATLFGMEPPNMKNTEW